LLDSTAVAAAALRTLLSGLTGHVIDVRRADPFSSHAMSADVADDMHQTEPHDEMPEGAESASSR
jgi:2-C-methyl-D-erythritol 4-phosphate cytidylyltransferase